MDITSRPARTSYTRRLRDPAALDADVVGAKAANLARAGREGFPVLPAFVVTTETHRAFLDHDRRLPDEVANGLEEPWRELSADGRDALVVRSSSVVEDASGAGGDDRSLLGLLLGGVRQDDAALGDFLALGGLDDDAVAERAELGRDGCFGQRAFLL